VAFAYEAIDSSGKSIKGVIDAGSAEQAGEELAAQGLFVTRVATSTEQVAQKQKKKSSGLFRGKAGSIRDLLLFAQQMSMMLRAGSRVVPAMEAIEDQITKEGWRKIVADIRQQVQVGASLSSALARHPSVFDETWQAIIAAAESTGNTHEAFDRLSEIAGQQKQLKVKIIGTLVYPAALTLLSLAVMGVMSFFVLPRFDELYTMLNTPLPWLTSVMLSFSGWLTNHKLLVGFIAIAVPVTPYVLWKLPGMKERVDRLLVYVPGIGKLARRIILARMFRVWGTSVRSCVPLIESLELARSSTKNVMFRSLMDKIIHEVSEGDTVGSVLMSEELVPRTMASAIATGEQSGQMDTALLFLADYMEQENSQKLASITRLVEPLILVLMGVAVGIMAISLFLPLFDLTSAA
jgi:type II secretory pathway component PulF